jgi:L-aspartate oxidase
MWNYVGLVRSPARLDRADQILSQLKQQVDSFYKNAELTPKFLILRNALTTALLVIYAAKRNPISKGCHFIEY